MDIPQVPPNPPTASLVINHGSLHLPATPPPPSHSPPIWQILATPSPWARPRSSHAQPV